MTEPVYDFVCSIGELIDKLSIENIKCYDANMRILEERRRPVLAGGFPAHGVDHARISELEGRARRAGEQRVRLRDEINRRLAEAISRGGFGAAADVRTYELGK